MSNNSFSVPIFCLKRTTHFIVYCSAFVLFHTMFLVRASFPSVFTAVLSRQWQLVNSGWPRCGSALAGIKNVWVAENTTLPHSIVLRPWLITDSDAAIHVFFYDLSMAFSIRTLIALQHVCLWQFKMLLSCATLLTDSAFRCWMKRCVYTLFANSIEWKFWSWRYFAKWFL